MNVLLVDDQKEITESLKNGIHWDSIPVEQVYTACSAREARLVLVNFPIDVLISDIEMPEEDGLSLCAWAKEKIENIECIFLTSHAEFEYAKEAIRMGGFDYILQPVRYADVEKTLCRAAEKIKEKKKLQQVMNSRKIVLEQRHSFLETLVLREREGKTEEVDRLYQEFGRMFQIEYENCTIYPLLVQIIKWEKLTRKWDGNLIRLVFCNVMEELFAGWNAKAAVSDLHDNQCWICLIMEREKIDPEEMKRNIQEFYEFIDHNMEFSIGIYPSPLNGEEDFENIFTQLTERAESNQEHKKGVYLDTLQKFTQKKEDPIERAIAFIQQNLNKSLSRAEVAEYVHLNEEYFSRLFRAETGATFKEYLLDEKMKEAKRLLVRSRLSVSIIASKVGYDNFSHFSKMFKKITGQTPQEYRKEQKEN